MIEALIGILSISVIVVSYLLMKSNDEKEMYQGQLYGYQDLWVKELEKYKDSLDYQVTIRPFDDKTVGDFLVQQETIINYTNMIMETLASSPRYDFDSEEGSEQLDKIQIALDEAVHKLTILRSYTGQCKKFKKKKAKN